MQVRRGESENKEGDLGIRQVRTDEIFLSSCLLSNHVSTLPCHFYGPLFPMSYIPLQNTWYHEQESFGTILTVTSLCSNDTFVNMYLAIISNYCFSSQIWFKIRKLKVLRIGWWQVRRSIVISERWWFLLFEKRRQKKKKRPMRRTSLSTSFYHWVWTHVSLY